MPFKTINTRKLPFFVALALATVLTSCGSFQYAGYDNDGIYATDEKENDTKETTVTTSTNDSNYYKNYFAKNSAEVNAIKEESEVFTDINSYEGNYVEQVTDTFEQQPTYGGWGQNNNTVTINYIDNGWMGWNDPWMWNGGYGWNNWGWNNRGWNNWGWNNWGWNSGWGYGWNAGWCPPGYNNWGWNNGYRNTNRYAYTNTRRGSLLYNNNLNRRSNSALTRRDYSTRRSSNTSATRQTRSTSVRNPNASTRTIRNTRTTRPTTRTTRPNSSTRTTRSTRSTNTRSTPSRSTRSSSMRSNSRSTRSSGSSRSSSKRRRG